MKKIFLLSALSLLTLSSCEFKVGNLVFSNNKNTEQTQSQNEEGSNTETENNEDNTGGNNTGENTGGNTGGETGGNTGGNTETVDSDFIPKNTPYSLEDYTTFKFNDGKDVDYPQDWKFYYGTSLNPNGQLWKNPNENIDQSGVEFLKNCYIISPMFNPWEKIEVRFNFWFSSHTSTKYKATENEPQFKLKTYTSTGKGISTTDIKIEKSDIPKTNTTKEVRFYIKENTCCFFELVWNNYIPNGSSGYSAILCSSTLKGWPYSN